MKPKRTPTRAARFAIYAMFFFHGMVFSNWAARIPDVQSKLGLSEASLGLALLGLSIGVIVSLPFVGGVISRIGSHRVAVIGGAVYALALVPISLAPSFITLFLSLLMLGFAGGFNDIAINAQGVEVERRAGKSLISSMHALYSMGLAVGAFLGGRFVGGSLLLHLGLAAAVLSVANLAVFRFLLPIEGEGDEGTPAFSLPGRALWGIGLVVFLGTIAEGGMVDWSTKYMIDVVGEEGTRAALGLTVFSALMTVGRFGGDMIVRRFSRVTILRTGAVFAGSGLLIAVVFPSFYATLAGFALTGLGLATVVPLGFSIAGNTPGVPSGAGIAGVASIGYSSFLAGPPLIGFVAELTSLRASFGIVAGLLGVMFVMALVLRPVGVSPRPAQAHSTAHPSAR